MDPATAATAATEMSNQVHVVFKRLDGDQRRLVRNLVEVQMNDVVTKGEAKTQQIFNKACIQTSFMLLGAATFQLANNLKRDLDAGGDIEVTDSMVSKIVGLFMNTLLKKMPGASSEGGGNGDSVGIDKEGEGDGDGEENEDLETGNDGKDTSDELEADITATAAGMSDLFKTTPEPEMPPPGSEVPSLGPQERHPEPQGSPSPMPHASKRKRQGHDVDGGEQGGGGNDARSPKRNMKTLSLLSTKSGRK